MKEPPTPSLPPSPTVSADEPRASALETLAWLAWLSLLLPLAAYLAVGAYRYVRIVGDTELRVDRSLRIATEHALKVMDTTEGLLARVGDVARGPSERLAELEPTVHPVLRALAADKPQLQNILVFGRDGRPQAMSRFFPAPRVDVSDRDYFRWHREGRGGLYVSQPLVSRTTGEPFFDVSVPRLEPDGRFGGVLSVSLLIDYFLRFHEDLAADEPGLAIAVARDDGSVISRWPRLVPAPQKLVPDSAMVNLIREGVTQGRLRGPSPIDGRERVMAFRKLGPYPMYIQAGMDVAAMRGIWLREMAWLAAFGGPPALGLFFVARLALRRSRDALESARRLRQETEARRHVEEALLQAQKLEALGRLTGGVAHDFNNALMVISNNLELMRMKQPEAVGRYTDAMGRAVDSATRLTRQLLAFSRRQALVPEQLVLQQRLPAVRDLLAPALGSRMAMDIEVDPGTRPIRVDPAEFELALLNLAINARDATGQKGRLTLSARNAGDDERPPLAKGPMVLVEVADDGPGIAPDVLPRVFEPFFTTKPVGEGTGLGLSQVYALCQRAGGAVTIDSPPGQGTRVRMFFPPDAAPAPREDTVPPLKLPPGLRVLLVEDNAEVAGALVPMLEGMGCTVTHFDRARPARDWLAAQAKPPDVMLSDVVMPGEMDGAALAREVRGRWPGMPVVLMTGYAEQIGSIAREGHPVLPKPCTPAMLSYALARAVSV